MSYLKKKKVAKKDVVPVQDRMDRLRILWSSNAVFASSGYATQSQNILYRMLEAGFPVAQQAFYGLMGGIIQLDGLVIYPRLEAPWGEDGLIQHAKDWQADVVFTFQDIWAMNPNYLKSVKNWIPYVPIDSNPLSESITSRLNLAYEIVTHSKFGHELLVDNGYSSTYIPLGTDTKVFRPMDKSKCREMFSLPQDKFIFGMVAANKDNPSRKSFQEVLDAFKRFSDKHENTAIFIHNNLNHSGGFPIREYAKFLGIKEDQILGLKPYDTALKLNREATACLINTFNITLNPSTNEGFGIVITESQACGVPVIVNNSTSMVELVGAGEICEVSHRRWNGMGSYSDHPSVDSLYDKMESLYKRVQENGDELSIEARKHIVDNYDMDMVFKKMWLPYLLRLQSRLKQTHAT